MKPKVISIILIIFVAVCVAIATCNCKSTQPEVTSQTENIKTDKGVWITFPVTCNTEQIKQIFFSYDTSISVFPYTYQGIEFKNINDTETIKN